MRIAVVTQSRDRVGGVEAYLEGILPALADRFELVFWTATDETTDRGALTLPAGVPMLKNDASVADTLAPLRAWRPDLLFVHGLDDPLLECQVLRLAPAVFVVHTYRGACISSTKTMSWPAIKCCERRFSAACLALYFPRRCGGLSPVTMVRAFGGESRRLAALRQAAAIVTLSSHMAREVVRNGVDEARVHVIPPFVAAGAPVVVRPPSTQRCELLYLGRLERLKGVSRLLAALPDIAARIQRPVRLVVAGDGAERPSLERQANEIRLGSPGVEVDFVGWQAAAGRSRLLAASHALVMPSLWPEPFGLVGLEAGSAGLPVVAFATGGIPEWLRDGENGCLAPHPGARAEALADAVARCVSTPAIWARLSKGMHETAQEFTLERHLRVLTGVFSIALDRSSKGPKSHGVNSSVLSSV